MTEENATQSKFSADKKQIFTLPNILTYLRILCTPAFILLYIFVNENIMIAFGVFVFASVTDVLDGRIARRFNMVSDIGKALDPLADKLLQVSVIVLLTIYGRVHWIFAVLILVKELYMVVGGILLVKRNIIAQANLWGKISAFLFAVAIILAFFDHRAIVLTSIIVFSLGVAFTYYAAVNYTIFSIKAYKKYIANKDDNRIYLDYTEK